MHETASTNLSSLRWVTFVGGLAIAIFAGFHFFHASAQTVATEKLEAQNLINGRLVVTRGRFGMSTNEKILLTSNPDGMGVGGVSISSSVLFSDQSAWSPDGTKIAFVGFEPTTGDIYVTNGDGTGTSTNLTNTPAITEGGPAWSVTGKIAYGRGSEIWTMNADGGGQALFSAITRPAGDPAWSSEGSKLAFTSGGEIWVINANGTNEHVVTMNTSTDSQPAWSPDGSKIAFRKAGTGIAVVNADGTNEMPLTNNSADQRPSWSPDGTKLAFTGGDGVYTMDANGANQIRIFANLIQFPLPCCDIVYTNPVWQPVAQSPSTFTVSGRVSYNGVSIPGATVNLSGTTNAATTTDATGNYQFGNLPAGGNYTVSPSVANHYFTPPNRTFSNLSSTQTANFEVRAVCLSGRCVKNGKIAFQRGGEILTINADGTGSLNITNNAAFDDEPAWSPDGALIAFVTNRDGNDEIYRMNADGGNPVRLTNNAATEFAPSYSPDGSMIVFSTTRDGNNEIYRMNADGSNQINLTNDPNSDIGASFSPDGTKIIFSRFGTSAPDAPRSLLTMNIDGSNQQVIGPSTTTIGIYEGAPTYSPDGSKIMFTYRTNPTTFAVTWTSNADGSGRAQFPQDGRDGKFSPDGTRVTFTCCQFNSTNRLMTSTASGTSPQNVTPSNTGNAEPDWQGFRVPRTLFDFDGDGKSDQAIFRPSTTDWWHLSSIDSSQRAASWGTATDVLAPADYDGDLKTDHAVWRPSTGDFHILNSFDNTVRIENFGLAGDVPTGGDFDGDNKADVAVYRPGAQSVFYYRASIGNPQRNISVIGWGVSGDKPVVGDYDGDGRSDAAVFRPSNGTWYVNKSSDGQLHAVNFGIASDVIVPADYDADGKTDFAVFRNGIWYLLQSSRGFSAFQFGLTNDTPVPADYDGDGRADASIFRDGVWWMLKSGSGAEAVQFGFGTDVPIQSAFVR